MLILRDFLMHLFGIGFFVCGKFGGTIDAIMKDKIELYIYPSFFFNFILFCFGISITSCH
jgi:hypothetical protein